MKESIEQIKASKKLLFRIRTLIIAFVICLVISGITAFPVETLLGWGMEHKHWFTERIQNFLAMIYEGIKDTNARYPYIAYGFDWLAFAHIVIGLAFIGPWRNPVKNIWVIEWAMMCCVAIFPLAFICGPIRGIPLFWTLIDCSFGFFGIIPLWICWRWIKRYEQLKSHVT
ncbi:MAG: hypothetical protein ACKVOR_01180 [Flavobacteriales bacterium]